MTEAQWLGCTNPEPMLTHLGEGASDRKLRLFAVACCRRVAYLIQDAASWRAVEVAEQYADGLVSRQALRACYEETYGHCRETLRAWFEQARGHYLETLRARYEQASGRCPWGDGLFAYLLVEA